MHFVVHAGFSWYFLLQFLGRNDENFFTNFTDVTLNQDSCNALLSINFTLEETINQVVYL